MSQTRREKERRSRRESASSDNTDKQEKSGNKFSTTWRPAGDYVHLKIQFMVQDTNLQVELIMILICLHDLLDHGTKLHSLGN